MTHSPPNPLIITQGDPAGIGPEIAVKAWFSLRASREHVFAIAAVPDTIAAVLSQMNGPKPALIDNLDDIDHIFPKALPVLPITGEQARPGQPDPLHATSITNSIQTAVTLCAQGKAAGLVTNPIAKNVLYQAGFKHPGHTEYLGELTRDMPMPRNGTRGPIMMLSGGGLRVALTTIHMPLKEAILHLTSDAIQSVAHIVHEALMQDFGIAKPRIALTGLNPHAGENGALGHEEHDIINPAAKQLREDGITITDAQSADSMFHPDARKTYDAIITMYHDQGLIPVKTLDFYGGVNITLGLPIIRTSPDHGTAFGIAGQGIARADSLIAAIRAARDMATHRMRYLNG